MADIINRILKGVYRMSRIILSSSSTAQWQQLVHDGEVACDIQLGEELESYLVFLLMRYLEKPELMSRVMALEFINSLESTGQIQQEQLREVGDCCLLFSGFFPKIADKRRVNVSYYVGIGQSAYLHLADTCQKKLNQLFQQVGHGFVNLMDVLQAIRSIGKENLLNPLEAMELWQSSGSTQALKSVQQVTQGIPVYTSSDIKH